MMNKTFFYLLALLFLISCDNSSTAKTTSNKNSNTLSSPEGDTIIKETTNGSEKVDSIDRANSNMIATDAAHVQKAVVSESDSLIWLTANMKLDHRIFGYEKPDTGSKKMILISIFTDDVDGNPFNCPFGSYYQSSNLIDMELKYISTEGQFIKANIIRNDTVEGTVYIDKRWIEFEDCS